MQGIFIDQSPNICQISLLKTLLLSIFSFFVFQFFLDWFPSVRPQAPEWRRLTQGQRGQVRKIKRRKNLKNVKIHNVNNMKIQDIVGKYSAFVVNQFKSNLQMCK